MEKRRPTAGKIPKSSDLPQDYLRMVEGVVQSNFSDGIDALEKITSRPRVLAGGKIYPDEIILSISLVFENNLAAITVYASVDFDPLASSPKAEVLLAAALDAQGAFFDQVLFTGNKERLEQIAGTSLSALEGEELPFEWTMVDINRRKVWLKMDKSNPELDAQADQWLTEHDPQHAERSQREAEEAEELFRTPQKAHGKNKKKTVH